jgi:hypothetical protein
LGPDSEPWKSISGVGASGGVWVSNKPAFRAVGDTGVQVRKRFGMNAARSITARDSIFEKLRSQLEASAAGTPGI